MGRYATPHGAFHIDALPGQPQIAHCHSFFIQPAMRNKSHGTAMKAEQMSILAAEKYDYATCTIDASNTAQRRVLEKSGWQQLAIFANRRTGGKTELWGYIVPDGERQ